MRAVVFTGASGGIGRATALTSARHGFDVYAGVRKPADTHADRRLASTHQDLADNNVEITRIGTQ